jgi:hypothetical protein
VGWGVGPANVDWRERARRVLDTVVELLSNLVLALAAVGLSVLAVDDVFARK